MCNFIFRTTHPQDGYWVSDRTSYEYSHDQGFLRDFHHGFTVPGEQYWIDQEQKFPYNELQIKLKGLYKEIPVTIDGQLINAIEKQIQRIKITLTDTEKGRLHDYITNFELEKFR